MLTQLKRHFHQADLFYPWINPSPIQTQQAIKVSFLPSRQPPKQLFTTPKGSKTSLCRILAYFLLSDEMLSL